ncbi:MAG: hypothetical protein IPP94_14900 [Ignavibacteria bacterium]|nr:hypothetical protein [Ignavibacteria bacterium]
MYEHVYENIDLELVAAAGTLKYNFIVHAGGRAGDIRMKYSGATALARAEYGMLRMNTAPGRMETASSDIVVGADQLDAHILYSGTAKAHDVRVIGESSILASTPWSTYYGGARTTMVPRLLQTQTEMLLSPGLPAAQICRY